MLINDFFQLTEIRQVDNQLQCSVILNSSHAIFSGHFPGNPITPGVVQIQMIREILEKHFNRSIQMVSMSRCKFLKILNPEEVGMLRITIDLSNEGELIKVNATCASDQNIFFKISAAYE